jgi:hypothetical protein
VIVVGAPYVPHASPASVADCTVSTFVAMPDCVADCV